MSQPAAESQNPAPAAGEPEPSMTRVDRHLQYKYLMIERRTLKYIAGSLAVIATVTGIGLWQLIRESIKSGLTDTVAKQATDRILVLESMAQDARKKAEREANSAVESARIAAQLIRVTDTEMGIVGFNPTRLGGWKKPSEQLPQYVMPVQFSKGAFVTAPAVQIATQSVAYTGKEGGFFTLVATNITETGFEIHLSSNGKMETPGGPGPLNPWTIVWTAFGIRDKQPK
jgi:H-type lectin domain-containing protein